MMATTTNAVLAMRPLGFPWRPPDPFLACMHHDDRYPAGNERMGPAAPLSGRDLGQDFEGRDGWRMYHGETVPGFPQHPHRGFETVTVARRGVIDHADSLGATARYGDGDVQWLTTGRGVLHSEMFPLLRGDQENPLELFQIWLNLPSASKLATPHFSMFWEADLPRVVERTDAGAETRVTVIAGALGGRGPLSPPPESWAARPDADVAIWLIELAPGARWTLPAASSGSNRALFAFRGAGLRLDGGAIPPDQHIDLRADRPVALEAGDERLELLMLQGRPIGEPVAQYGPFVMTSRAELQQAFADYQQTQFGGWRWDRPDPVHPRTEGRFARHADGREERPGERSGGGPR